MTPANSPSLLRSLALGDVDSELANTRRVLERLPESRWEWRPHPKSWTLGGLGTHVARLPHWGVNVVTQPEFDLASIPTGIGPVVESAAELLALFDANAAAMRAALAGIDDEALGAQWTLRNGAHVIMQMPRALALRSATVSHMVHHRAQLGVYLRMLDVPVPGMYGPSADEGR